MTLKLPFPNDGLTYGAEWLRYTAEVSGLQEGVVGADDLKVTAAAAGGMRVDIAAGTAMVKGDSGSPGTGVSQGLYMAVNDASIPDAVTLPASNGTNPRIDQIALRVRDASDLGTGADDLTLLYLAGSAIAGATLDNRDGAASLPADHLRLADILVPAGSTAVTAGNIRDRRPWARGANARLVGNTSDASVPAGGSGVALLLYRYEVSAGSIVEIGTTAQVKTPASVAFNIAGLMNGSVVYPPVMASSPGDTETAYSGRIAVVPGAGSHSIGLNAYASAAGVVVRANSSTPLILTVREIVAQNAAQA